MRLAWMFPADETVTLYDRPDLLAVAMKVLPFGCRLANRRYPAASSAFNARTSLSPRKDAFIASLWWCACLLFLGWLVVLCCATLIAVWLLDFVCAASAGTPSNATQATAATSVLYMDKLRDWALQQLETWFTLMNISDPAREILIS
jgi:hypothetical protein